MTEHAAQIRTARAQDAEGIARVHVDSWRETYSGLVPERFFDEDAFEARREMWNRYLALDAPYGTLVVAERADRIIGFAFAGPSHVADAENGHESARDLHLFSIYLLSVEQGVGTGAALLEAAIGDQPAQLWVARENSRARAFYERNGFRADGVQVTDADLGLIEIRMVR